MTARSRNLVDRLTLSFGLALLPAVAPPIATGQGLPTCSTLTSQVTLGALSGQRIDSVLVETARPNLGRFARLIARVHVTTRHEVVRRELLFAVGDSVDTLKVAETLRRLRKLAFLEDAHIEARRCVVESGRGTLALAVMTRDAWTTRPDLKPGASPRVSLTEKDLFGTGRQLSLELVSRDGNLGVGASAADAFGFGTGMATRVRYQRFSSGVLRSISIGRRQSALNDRWRAQLELFDLRHEPNGAAIGDDFERNGGSFLGGIRLGAGQGDHIVHLLGGIETEHTSLAAAPNAALIGPDRVERRFTAPEIGLALTSAHYDTLTWLLPGGAVVDVPRTFEGEVVIGVGRGTVSTIDAAVPPEVSRSNFMTHFDGWVGREWLPTRSSRIVGDVWASGYSRFGAWHSRRMRAAITGELAASRGVWRFTAAGEQLRDPDPDVRALGISDRALAFLPRRVRLAESAITLSIERTRHLLPIGGSLELDGAVYGAFSKRLDPAPAPTSVENYSVGVAGVGIALTPRRRGRATVRLDFGVPLSPSPGIARTPRVSITVTPWPEAGRHRDRSGTY